MPSLCACFALSQLIAVAVVVVLATTTSHAHVWDDCGQPDFIPDVTRCTSLPDRRSCRRVPGCDWYGRAASCQKNPWCERIRSSALVRTPSNTCSALAYEAASAFMAFSAVADARAAPPLPPLNPLLELPWLSATAAGANLLHAFGVFWYHGSMCDASSVLDGGGRYDGAGMDAAVMFNAAYLACLLVVRRRDKAAAVAPATETVARRVFAPYFALVALVLFRWPSEAIVGACFAGGIALSVLLAAAHLCAFAAVDRPRIELLGAAILCLACGVAVWAREISTHQCPVGFAASSPVQPHAIWHVFTAGALALAYAYARTMGCGDRATAVRVLTWQGAIPSDVEMVSFDCVVGAADDGHAEQARGEGTASGA